MKICFVVHSVISCWNNGNAHFLRGVIAALQARGHIVSVLESAESWSRTNLVTDAGEAALAENAMQFRHLAPSLYQSVPQALDALAAAEPDLVIVHEWNNPGLVNAIGARRRAGERFVLLFHDTHHRALSQPEEMLAVRSSGYDGILAFGGCLAEIYRQRGWGRQGWTWHEAADTRLFRPLSEMSQDGDLVWIGNWGDGERGEELREFFVDPAAQLGLRTTVHGVRYPAEALAALERANIRYAGWLPNHRVPECFARHRVTVHVPRRPYAETLPGIPTIRVFEALACGIPLVSAPWSDAENLFPPGTYLTAHDGDQMRRHLAAVLADRRSGRGTSGEWPCRDPRPPYLRPPRRRATCHLFVTSRKRAGRGAGAMNFAFFGSSLVSAYWNGAATYYRGLIKALAARGHRIAFYEPDAFGRQQHRDIDDPEWARVVVYPPSVATMKRMLDEAVPPPISSSNAAASVCSTVNWRRRCRRAGMLACRRSSGMWTRRQRSPPSTQTRPIRCGCSFPITTRC